jgi:hypothetical protein
MTIRAPRYRPRRINGYVPAMQYASDVIHNAPYDALFGPLALASATAIINAQSMAVAGFANLGQTGTAIGALVTDTIDAYATYNDTRFPYGPGWGRALQYVASGASTGTVTVRGKDYLGQPVTEAITLNGATPVNGKKAFKYIDSITWTVTAATTLNVGTTAILGLPYRMMNVLSEELAGVRVGTLGTLTTPDQTDPGTTTTGDPRGTYTPNSTLNGTSDLSAIFIPNFRLNTNNNGGLHGLAHFYS